jgi:hypothetical protein
MGPLNRWVVWLMVGLGVAGCAPQSRPSVAVPVFRNTTAPQAVTTDPKIVDNVAAALNGLDANAYRSVSMAEAGGSVLLVGAVVRPDYRRQLELRVGAVPGVTAVSDHILVVDNSVLDQFRADLSKERDLAGRLPPGLALRVVHGVAYLVGVVGASDLTTFKESVADDPAIQWVDATAVAVR